MDRKKATIKRVVMPVPQDLKEAAEFIVEIGKNQRKIKQIQDSFNEEIETLKKEAMVSASPLEEKISQLSEGLFIFAQSHRLELTEGGKYKTVELPTGIFGWRLTPWKVSLRNAKEILRILTVMDLTRFIRIKEEVDKKALLKEPEVAQKIKGISISQREEFFVKPAEIELEITRPAKKLKKTTSKQ